MFELIEYLNIFLMNSRSSFNYIRIEISFILVKVLLSNILIVSLFNDKLLGDKDE